MKNLDFKPNYGGVSSYLLKNRFAFTLVEMVVVVMIIIILATIAFLRLWNYSSEANLAKRASDKKNIETYNINTQKAETKHTNKVKDSKEKT